MVGLFICILKDGSLEKERFGTQSADINLDQETGQKHLKRHMPVGGYESAFFIRCIYRLWPKEYVRFASQQSHPPHLMAMACKVSLKGQNNRRAVIGTGARQDTDDGRCEW